MKSSSKKEELVRYLCKQIKYFFPDTLTVNQSHISKHTDEIFERVELCFSHIKDKNFQNDPTVPINYLNGDQYAMFLYFVSNTLYRNNVDRSICSKVYLLNKFLHGLDIFYEVELPDIFMFVHPIGTVLGRAEYSDFLLVYQGCYVGANIRNQHPKLGKYLSLHPRTSVFGHCVLGENCTIGTGSLIMDMHLKPNSKYIGNPKGYTISSNQGRHPVWK